MKQPNALQETERKANRSKGHGFLGSKLAKGSMLAKAFLGILNLAGITLLAQRSTLAEVQEKEEFFANTENAHFYKIGKSKGCHLLTDLSAQKVIIGGGFKGKKITIFGNKNCPDGKMIFIFRGREKNIKVKKSITLKKDISSNYSKPIVLTGVPSLYLLKTKHKVADITSEIMASKMSIGIDKIKIQQKKGGLERAQNLLQLQQARQKITAEQLKKGLFDAKEKNLEDVAESKTMFKSTFFLPAGIEPGVYTIETIAMSEGRPRSISIDPFFVLQSNISRAIREVAKNNKKYYYAITLLTAVGMGLLSFVIFNITGEAKLRRRRR